MKPAAESALAKIRKQRKGEAKAIEQYEVRDENAEIYQTVTEEDYQKLKETRRKQHWVEGEGYSDDGEEWWESGSEEDLPHEEEEDEGEDTYASRRDGALACSAKRKKNSLQQEWRNGHAAATGGCKRARKGAGGGAREGAAGDARQQQQSMRMRSLVQHFTARAAETAAAQQQQRLTQRDAESLRSIDMLLEDEEEEEDTSGRPGGRGDPRFAGKTQRPSSQRPCDTTGGAAGAAADGCRPYAAPAAGGRAAAAEQNATGPLEFAGRHREAPSWEAARTFSQDHTNRADARLEPTQILDVASNRSRSRNSSFSPAVSSNLSRGYSQSTSFLEQLGLGNCCAGGGDELYAVSREGRLPAALSHPSATSLPGSGSSSNSAQHLFHGGEEVKGCHVVRRDTGKEEDEGQETLYEAHTDMRAAAAGGNVARAAEREEDRCGPRLEGEGGGEAVAGEELRDGGEHEYLFKSTGEFEFYRTGGEVSLLKHAQSNLFSWGQEAEETEKQQQQEASAGEAAAAAAAESSSGDCSTAESKKTASSTVARAGGKHVELVLPVEKVLLRRSSAGVETETRVEAKVTCEDGGSSSSPAHGGLPCCRDGSLPFFLLDAWEEGGLLFLFGKVWRAAAEAANGAPPAALQSRGRSNRMRTPPPESCCVIVRDMMVPLFFYTREQVAHSHLGTRRTATSAASDPRRPVMAGSESEEVSSSGREGVCSSGRDGATSSGRGEASTDIADSLQGARQLASSCSSSKNHSSSSSSGGIATMPLAQEEDEEEVLRQRLKHRLDITRSFFLQDAQRLKKKYQWRKIAVKGVFRHYAFDVPAVPRERHQTFVKMYVPAGSGGGPLLQPEDWEGQTYSHVFGSRPSLVEVLLVKRRIKGPCWLRIQDFSSVESPLDRLSWCKYEVTVHSHKAICCWNYKLQPSEVAVPFRSSPSSPSASAVSGFGVPVDKGDVVLPAPTATAPTAAAAGICAEGGAAVAVCSVSSLAAAGELVQALLPPPPPPLTVVSVCAKTIQVSSVGSRSSSSCVPPAPCDKRRVTPSEEKQLAIAAFFVYRNADIDDQAAAAPRLTSQTAFCAVRRMHFSRSPAAGAAASASADRPVQSTARVVTEGIPLRFPEACAQQGFALFDTERSLLLSLVNQIAAADPDILVGHDIYSCTLNLLAQRLTLYGLPVWHRLSRLKRGKQQLKSLRMWSQSSSSSSKHSFAGVAPGGTVGPLWGGRMLTVGRLVCDTYLQARELLSHRVDYDLLNLVQALFFPRGLPSATAARAATAAAGIAGAGAGAAKGEQQPFRVGPLGDSIKSGAGAILGEQQRLEAAVKGLRMFPQHQELLHCFQRREPQALLACLHLTLQEAYITLLLCWRLNCLPLTRELTTIGGNLWNRSLQNQRAERNAFLLLHEFYREKYVCPDPPLSPEAAAAAAKRKLLRRGGAPSPGAPAGTIVSQRLHNSRPKKKQAFRSGEAQVAEDAGERERGKTGVEEGGNQEEYEDGDDVVLADGAVPQEEEEEAVLGRSSSSVATQGRGGGDAAAAGASFASYTGGLVLEPRIGFYETFVLLLDFNSLYPSIIQEFNVCFSTVKRAVVGDCSSRNDGSRSRSGIAADGSHAIITTTTSGDGISGQTTAECEVEDDCASTAARVQGVSSTPGILPRILRQLVQRRRAVKASVKTEMDPLRRAALDVKQLALKLTANSIYGCLGFSRSRFYARELAAFITQQGRNVLLATKEKVERVLRLEVLYGDTDSLMINTGLHDDGGVGKAYAQAVRLGEQVKAEINRHYRRLELDLEAVFRRLLLLRKKKYACCVVVDYAKQQYRLEQKGLDFVRRDWAKLTRVVGQQLLEILFNTGGLKANAALSPSCILAEHGEQQKGKRQLQGQGQQRLETVQGGEEATQTVDVVVEKLHAKLQEIARLLKEKNVPLEYFVITKALTKLPHLYAKGAGGTVMHPHVQVALRMQKQGVPIKAGSEIPFVVCTEESARAVLYPRETGVDGDCLVGGRATAAAAGTVPTETATTTRRSVSADAVAAGGAAADDKSSNSSMSAALSRSTEAATQSKSNILLNRSADVGSSCMSRSPADDASAGEERAKKSCCGKITSSREDDGNNRKEGSRSSGEAFRCSEKKKTPPPLSAAERAFHPREVLANPLLELDVKYYIEQQLLPPVVRLCAHVQGTSAERLATCLGLDGSKHHARSRATATGSTRWGEFDEDEEERCSREARERAGEEQILALLTRTDDKYKHHPLPIHLRCESCRTEIAGKDVLRFMRCPSCLWWISPSVLSNFVSFTLAILQRRFSQAVLRCSACEERYMGVPAPPAAFPCGLPSASATAWLQQQQRLRAATVASGLLQCPRCEEGPLREEMSSHDMYVYLDQLLFYCSGNVSSQQKRLAEQLGADEHEKAKLIWKHCCNNNSGGPALGKGGSILAGSAPRRGRGDDMWLVPAGLDANLRMRVLEEKRMGKEKPPSGSGRTTAAAEGGGKQDLFEELYGRVSQQEVSVKRGAQLRFPGLTAAVTYWQKSKRGLGWIDMQQQRNKLRETVMEVMDQNAYRMLQLSSLFTVMRPPPLLDPTKRRWYVVQKLNLQAQKEGARGRWNEELRCRAPALLASLHAAVQSAEDNTAAQKCGV